MYDTALAFTESHTTWLSSYWKLLIFFYVPERVCDSSEWTSITPVTLLGNLEKVF